jgi:hypothetical protein
VAVITTQCVPKFLLENFRIDKTVEASSLEPGVLLKEGYFLANGLLCLPPNQ